MVPAELVYWRSTCCTCDGRLRLKACSYTRIFFSPTHAHKIEVYVRMFFSNQHNQVRLYPVQYLCCVAHHGQNTQHSTAQPQIETRLSAVSSSNIRRNGSFQPVILLFSSTHHHPRRQASGIHAPPPKSQEPETPPPPPTYPSLTLQHKLLLHYCTT